MSAPCETLTITLPAWVARQLRYIAEAEGIAPEAAAAVAVVEVTSASMDALVPGYPQIQTGINEARDLNARHLGQEQRITPRAHQGGEI